MKGEGYLKITAAAIQQHPMVAVWLRQVSCSWQRLISNRRIDYRSR